MWKAVISHRENDLGFLLKCLIEDIEGKVIAKAEKQPHQMTKTELINLIARANRIKEGGLRYNELKAKTKKELVSMAEKGITRMRIEGMRRGSQPNAYDEINPLSAYPASFVATGMPKEIKDIDDKLRKLKKDFAEKVDKEYGSDAEGKIIETKPKELETNFINIFPGYYSGKSEISEVYSDRQDKDRRQRKGLYASKEYKELKSLLEKRKKMVEDYNKEVKNLAEKGRQYLKAYIQNPTDEEFEKYIKNITDLGSAKYLTEVSGQNYVVGKDMQVRMREMTSESQIKRNEYLREVLSASNKAYKKKRLHKFLDDIYSGWRESPNKIIEEIDKRKKKTKAIKVKNEKLIENLLIAGSGSEEANKTLSELKSLISDNKQLFDYLSKISEFQSSSEKEIREHLTYDKTRSEFREIIFRKYKGVVIRVLELLKLIALDDNYGIDVQKKAGNIYRKIQSASKEIKLSNKAGGKSNLEIPEDKLQIPEPNLGPRVVREKTLEENKFERREAFARLIELNAEIKEAKKEGKNSIVKIKGRELAREWRKLTDMGLGESLDSALNDLVDRTTDFYADLIKRLDVVDVDVEESKEYNNIRRIRKAVAGLMEKVRDDKDGMEKAVLGLFSELLNKRRYDNYVRSNLFAYDGKKLEIVSANPKIFKELKGTGEILSAADRLREVLIGSDAMRGKNYIDIVNEELGKKYKTTRIARYTIGVDEKKKKTQSREQKDSVSANKNLATLKKNFLVPVSKLAEDIIPSLPKDYSGQSGNEAFKDNLEQLVKNAEILMASTSLPKETQEKFEENYIEVSKFLKQNVGKGPLKDFIRDTKKSLKLRIATLDKEGTYDSPEEVEEREAARIKLKEAAEETLKDLGNIDRENVFKSNKVLYKALSKLRRIVLSSGNVTLLKRMKILSVPKSMDVVRGSATKQSEEDIKNVKESFKRFNENYSKFMKNRKAPFMGNKI